MGFSAEKSEYSFDMRTDAPAQEVFPLLCPVREDDWVVGWKEARTMIWSESGVAELGAVFRTQHGTEPAQTWVVTRYEPDERIAFARFDGDVVTRLEIELHEADGATHSRWTTSQVGTSEQGNARVRAASERDHDALRRGLELELEHYLATGEMIDPEALPPGA